MAQSKIDYIVTVTGAADTAKEFSKVNNSVSSLLKTSARVAAGFLLAKPLAAVAAGLYLTKKAVEVYRASLPGLYEAIKAETKLAAVLKATGGAAGKTRKELLNTADALERLTGIDAQNIQTAQTILLTFNQIRGKNLDRATKAALDLSTVFGSDLRSASIQLGKALQDPIRGLNALSRSGISFSNETRNVIKTLVETGETAKAQELFFKAVEEQVGGAAEALGKTAPLIREKARLAAEGAGEEFTRVVDHVIVRWLHLPQIATGISNAIQGIFKHMGETIGAYTESITQFKGPEAIKARLEVLAPAIEKLKREVDAARIAREKAVVSYTSEAQGIDVLTEKTKALNDVLYEQTILRDKLALERALDIDRRRQDPSLNRRVTTAEFIQQAGIENEVQKLEQVENQLKQIQYLINTRPEMADRELKILVRQRTVLRDLQDRYKEILSGRKKTGEEEQTAQDRIAQLYKRTATAQQEQLKEELKFLDEQKNLKTNTVEQQRQINIAYDDTLQKLVATYEFEERVVEAKQDQLQVIREQAKALRTLQQGLAISAQIAGAGTPVGAAGLGAIGQFAGAAAATAEFKGTEYITPVPGVELQEGQKDIADRASDIGTLVSSWGMAASAAANYASTITNVVLQAQAQAAQQQADAVSQRIADIQREKEVAIAAAEEAGVSTLAARQVYDEQLSSLEKKKQAIIKDQQKKQLEVQKALAISQITIAGAVGIVSAWKTGNPILAAFVTGLVVAAMGTAIGMVASAPALAQGGIVPAQPGGGLYRLGEAGRPETVLPYDIRRRGAMMGNTTNYAITIAGDTYGVDDLVERISDAVQRQRTIGIDDEL